MKYAVARQKSKSAPISFYRGYDKSPQWGTDPNDAYLYHTRVIAEEQCNVLERHFNGMYVVLDIDDNTAEDAYNRAMSIL